jgi:hypothetical protein
MGISLKDCFIRSSLVQGQKKAITFLRAHIVMLDRFSPEEVIEVLKKEKGNMSAPFLWLFPRCMLH